jgi:hypothetical protein
VEGKDSPGAKGEQSNDTSAPAAYSLILCPDLLMSAVNATISLRETEVESLSTHAHPAGLTPLGFLMPLQCSLLELLMRVKFCFLRNLLVTQKLRLGIGSDITFYHVPEGLTEVYGSNRKSYHVFVRLRPSKMMIH